MKRGRDKNAHIKHVIRTLEKQDRELIGRVSLAEYMQTPSQAPRIAERHGLYRFWVFRCVKYNPAQRLYR